TEEGELGVLQRDEPAEDEELGVYQHEGLVEDEEEEQESYPSFRFGIGVGLSSKPFSLVGTDSTVGTPASLTNISLPLYLDRFRLEPEFGFFRQVGGATSFSLEALAFDLADEAFDLRTSSA